MYRDEEVRLTRRDVLLKELVFVERQCAGFEWLSEGINSCPRQEDLLRVGSGSYPVDYFQGEGADQRPC